MTNLSACPVIQSRPRTYGKAGVEATATNTLQIDRTRSLVVRKAIVRAIQTDDPRKIGIAG